MRANWWLFGFWFFGPMRYPQWRFKYDLRTWMFGVGYYFGAWTFSIGPFELQQMTTAMPPAQADLKAVK